MIPWFLKYNPASFSEVLNPQAVKLKDFIINSKNYKKKGMLVFGPSGSGKTASVSAIVNDLDLELVNVDGSSKRDSEWINKVVGAACVQGSLSGRSRVILVDEVDHLDRGGMAELIKHIKNSKNPVILTATDYWDDKLRSLRNVVEKLEYKKITSTNILKILVRICKEEKVQYDFDALRALSQVSNGDVRSAIIDLEKIARENDFLNEDALNTLTKRKRGINIFNALRKVFQDYDLDLKAYEDVDMEVGEIMLWTCENLINEYNNPEDIALAYDRLSRADIFLGRILKNQSWTLYPFVNALLTAGITFSKKKPYKKFAPYSSPQKIVKLGRTKGARSVIKRVSENISRECHVSSKRAHYLYFYFLKLFLKKQEWQDNLVNGLNLDADDIKLLVE